MVVCVGNKAPPQPEGGLGSRSLPHRERPHHPQLPPGLEPRTGTWAGGVSTRSPENLGSNPGSSANEPCDLGQGAEPPPVPRPPLQQQGCRAHFPGCGGGRGERAAPCQLVAPATTFPAPQGPQGGLSGGTRVRESPAPGAQPCGAETSTSSPNNQRKPSFLSFLSVLSGSHQLVHTQVYMTGPGFRIGGAILPEHRIPLKAGSLLPGPRRPSQRAREGRAGHSPRIQVASHPGSVGSVHLGEP